MELDYEFTEADFLTSIRRVIRTSPAAARAARKAILMHAGVVALMVILGAFSGYKAETNRALHGALVAASTIGSYALIQSAIHLVVGGRERRVARFVRTLIRRNEAGNVLGPLRLTADEAGITQTSPTWKTNMTWASLIGVEKSADGVYFWTSPIAAIFIPARAFASAADADSLIGLAALRGVPAVSVHRPATPRPLTPP